MPASTCYCGAVNAHSDETLRVQCYECGRSFVAHQDVETGEVDA